MVAIPKSEFEDRIRRIRERMIERGLDACLVYGDEWRKENLRYVSNYWPLFERGATVIPSHSDPILLVAPEGLEIAKEMSAWKDIRNLKELQAVTVPEEIEYSRVEFSSGF